MTILKSQQGELIIDPFCSTCRMEDSQPSLWDGLLKESLRRDRPDPRYVAIVGADGSGKRSLWNRFHGKRAAESACAPVHFSFVDVQPDELDLEEYVRVNLVAVKDGKAGEALLSVPLNAETVSNACILLVVDLSSVRDIPSTLKHWSQVLQDHVTAVFQKADGSLGQSLIDKLKRKILSYKEGEESGGKAGVVGEERGEEDLTLPDGVLTVNIGIPLVVVANKSDVMDSQDRSVNIQDEQWDCVQQYLRRFCIQHGASLIYTSAANANNCDKLWDTVLHLTHFPNKPLQPPSLLQRETVFVPAGWDSLDKVNVLLDEASADRASKILFESSAGRREREEGRPDVAVVDEQEFLRKFKDDLEKGHTSSSRERRAATGDLKAQSDKSPGAAALASTPAAASAAGASPSDPSKPDADSGEKKPVSEEALSNFFQSLLHRPANAPLKKDKAADAQIRKDAEQSLARLKTTPK